MTPIEIAKKALKEIVQQDMHNHVGARSLALEALAEIAIAEQEAPKARPPVHPMVRRLLGGHH